jgi:hypothetical protein
MGVYARFIKAKLGNKDLLKQIKQNLILKISRYQNYVPFALLAQV